MARLVDEALAMICEVGTIDAMKWLAEESAKEGRKPLTVPQIIEVTKKLDLSSGISWIDVIRAVEAAHGIN